MDDSPHIQKLQPIETLVAREVHALSQHRLDIPEIHLAFGVFGVAPSLARADQAEIVMGDDAQGGSKNSLAVRW